MSIFFIESSETQGLLYNRYYKLPGVINEFLNKVEASINMARKKQVPENNNLVADLNKFKEQITVNMNDPDPIDAHEINKIRRNVKAVKIESYRLIDRLGKVRKNFKFGDNWVKGVLFKPKVYSKGTDEEFHIKVNKFMRDAGRSLDWIEKATVDLMNLADQDLNILTLVSKVYFRKIYEYVDLDFDLEDDIDILDESIDDEEDYDYKIYEAAEEEKDVMDEEVPNKDASDFVPVITMITGFDTKTMKKDKSLDDKQRRMVKHGDTIKKVTLGDNYSHTLLSLDTSMQNVYHFLADGIDKTSIYDSSDFKITQSIYVAVTFVTKDELKTIKNTLDNYMKDIKQTGYDLTQLAGQVFGKAVHKDKRMVCSTFVGYILAQANVKNLNRDYAMIRPNDITILPRSFYVAQFKDLDDFKKRKGELDEKIKKIKEENIDEIIDYNSALPKTLVTTKMKEKGSIDKFFDWVVHLIDK